MQKVENPKTVSMPLQVQTGLLHRGGFGPETASLFPPPGTFEAIGGREAVSRLVDKLYDRFEADPVLRPAFGRDLTLEREKVKLFFEGWFGGSSTYFDADWPPGLQAAHGAVSISRGMAGRWVGHFLDAFAEAVPDPTVIPSVKPLIARLAMGLVNRAEEPVPGDRLRCSATNSDPRFLNCVQREDMTGIVELAAAEPHVMSGQGPRLLLTAAVRGKAGAVEGLLRQGVDVNAVAMLSGSEASACGLPILRITALCGALAKRRDAVVKLLVEHGAQYDIFTATFVGDLEGVEKLLDLAPELANAGDPACDVAQITPLMHAVVAEQVAIARLLFQRGATVGLNSVRLLRAAANQGREELTDLLLEHGADPTSLGAGAWVLYPALAAKLIAHGANVNRTPGAWVGICCTGNSGHKEHAALAQALLRCGADVTARYKGSMALHCAAKAGFALVVEALIAYGADVHARNDQGKTPLETLETAGRSIDREPIRRLLIAHGAQPS
ncbi:MAG: globin [Chthonomonadales bacterium]|nr:globin [Chthonomonadales bacterium]